MAYNYSPILNIMLKTSRKASGRLVRDYGEICHLQSSSRNIDNFIDTAKSKITGLLLTDLALARPDYSISIEGEIYSSKESSYCWEINPIDGIVNFTNGIPNFAVSIGLSKKNKDGKEIIASVVDAPILGETYFAEKGSGSWLEKHVESSGANFRLRVSAKNTLDKAVVGIIDGNYTANKDVYIRVDGTKDLALAYVAAGRYDAVIGYDEDLLEAASSLLVLEAGGSLKATNSRVNPVIAASNQMLKLFID